MVAPPREKIRRSGLRGATLSLVGMGTVEAAVVLTVSVAVTAEVLLIDTGAPTEQLGASTATAGPVTTHENFTVPLKPPLGVTVIVEVPLAPGAAMLTGVLVSAKPAGGAVTVTATMVLAMTAPLESVAFTNS